jgi:hypothetical protein
VHVREAWSFMEVPPVCACAPPTHSHPDRVSCFPCACPALGSGVVAIAVSGVVADPAALYDFTALVQAPAVTAVAPLRGPTVGGTLVTLQGAQFAGDAKVLFAERNRTGSRTGRSAECEWRTLDVPGVLCNDTVVR